MNPNGPEPVPSGPIPSSRPTGYSAAAIHLMGFKKGIVHQPKELEGKSQKKRLTVPEISTEVPLEHSEK